MERITRIEPTKHKRKRKLKVAAYARVSTGTEDQLISLQAQKIHYEQYITSRPDWEYAGIYYDEGISGTGMEKREGLKQLLKDCEKGRVSFIVVKSLSRFSRNTVECIETVRKLCANGIHLYFEKENIDTRNMEGELMLSILSSLAESESRSISENIRWGIRQRFLNGTYKIGYPPYGYDNIDGEMVINEEQAQVVRMIFHKVLDGVAPRTIAADLNQEGIPTKRGKKWASNVIHAMVRNEKYTGDVLLQKTFIDENYKSHINKGERDQYYIKDHHPAIVSRKVFKKANEMIRFNAREKGIAVGSGNHHNRYPFSGKILCGECGGKWKRIKLARYFAYSCLTHIEDKSKCGMKRIPEALLEGAFVTMMNKLTYGRSKILLPYAQALKEDQNGPAFTRICEIETALGENDFRKNQIVQFFSKGLLDPSVFEQERDMLTEEETRLLNEKEQIRDHITGGNKQNKALEKILKYTAKGKMLASFDGDLFTEHVDHILILGAEEVGFVMKCGPTFKERLL